MTTDHVATFDDGDFGDSDPRVRASNKAYGEFFGNVFVPDKDS